MSLAQRLRPLSALKPFDFDIVNFPFLDGDVPRSASYGVYISKLIRLARVSNILVIKFNSKTSQTRV